MTPRQARLFALAGVIAVIVLAALHIHRLAP